METTDPKFKPFRASGRLPNGYRAALNEIINHPLMARDYSRAVALTGQILRLQKEKRKCSKKSS